MKITTKGKIRMPEIHIHLSLTRTSGILAGIVAALAQENLALQTQKITRNTEDKGGSLNIVCEGEAPDIDALTGRMENCRGVGRLEFASIDGLAAIENGVRVEPEGDSAITVTAEPEPDNGESDNGVNIAAVTEPGMTEQASENDMPPEEAETTEPQRLTEETPLSGPPGEPASNHFSEIRTSPEPDQSHEPANTANSEPIDLDAAGELEGERENMSDQADKSRRPGLRRHRRLL